jgi:hypothetical protein
LLNEEIHDESELSQEPTGRKKMKLRASILLILLSMSLAIAASGEKPVPTQTVIVTDHKQTAPPSDNPMIERISRLMEFYDKSEQFGGAILVAQDGNIIYEDAFGWATWSGAYQIH